MAVGHYLIALGSNVRHYRYGSPANVVRAAIDALAAEVGISVECVSPIMSSAPLGPSRRQYANAVAILCTELDPPELLTLLKDVERSFGRKKRGLRWGSRVIDLDIVLWSGGVWVTDGLIVPHKQFRQRAFVLAPALAIAPDWRDPLSGLTLRQLHARLTRPAPLLR